MHRKKYAVDELGLIASKYEHYKIDNIKLDSTTETEKV